MTTATEARHDLDRRQVERLWQDHLAACSGERWPRRFIGRDTVGTLVAALTSEDGQRLILDRQRVLAWVVADAAGKSLPYAGERLGIFGRWLAVLVRAELLPEEFLAFYRTGRGSGGWRALAAASQSADPEAAIEAIRVPVVAGPLHGHLSNYLQLQRALGKAFDDQEGVLGQLDRFLRDRGITSPTEVSPAELERWLDGLGCDRRFHFKRARFTRRFFDYLVGLRVIAVNPVGRSLTHPARRTPADFRPFLFSREQLAQIIARARQLPARRCPRRAEVCATMLTLLATLGLRHGEARRLRLEHIDLDRGILLVEQTKFHKSRQLPFGPKVKGCLEEYLAVRRTLLQPVREDDYLFVSKWHKPVCLTLLMQAFRAILAELGIAAPPGQEPPRLHDIRHSFAVNRLLGWYRAGERDIQ